jgi:hypothetical protein
VFRAAGKTKSMQKNIEDWLQMDEGYPGFQILVLLQFLNKGSTATLFNLFSSALPILFNFPFICFLSFFFCLLELYLLH